MEAAVLELVREFVHKAQMPEGHEELDVALQAIYGRTCQNAEWVHKRLAEVDPRVRANAVESLWGLDSESIRGVLKHASRDQHHRVAVNALIGLHLTGAADATASLQKMARGSDPLSRAAAAFGMGRILKNEFKPVLEVLLRDTDARVRAGRSRRSSG